MKRVVVTGMGIVSSLGNNSREVLASLQNLKSGISFDESYREMGLRSHVAGNINTDLKEHIDRKALHPHGHRGGQRRRIFGIASGSGGCVARKRHQARWALCGNQNHGINRGGLLGNTV